MTGQLQFNIYTDYIDFEANTRRTSKPKLVANGVTLVLMMQVRYLLIFLQEN